MDKRAILKALGTASIVATVVLALLGGYTSSTTPDGVTTHHYSFRWIGFWLVMLPIFVIPSTFIVGYPISLLLFRLNLFNVYVVSGVGILGGISVVSVLFYQFPPALMVSVLYGFGGFVAALTAFLTYEKITKRSQVSLTNKLDYRG